MELMYQPDHMATSHYVARSSSSPQAPREATSPMPRIMRTRRLHSAAG
jgi:hypothetical protein